MPEASVQISRAAKNLGFLGIADCNRCFLKVTMYPLSHTVRLKVKIDWPFRGVNVFLMQHRLIRDVQLSSVRGLHGGAVGEAHRQRSLRFDFVQAWRIDYEKVAGASRVQY
jgi:hypothetical protein